MQIAFTFITNVNSIKVEPGHHSSIWTADIVGIEVVVRLAAGMMLNWRIVSRAGQTGLRWQGIHNAFLQVRQLSLSFTNLLSQKVVVVLNIVQDQGFFWYISGWNDNNAANKQERKKGGHVEVEEATVLVVAYTAMSENQTLYKN